jgi:molybdopterin biosynthesis enzyme
VLGALARLLGLGVVGWPGTAMAAALVMELVVTPVLCLWQARVARLSASSGRGRE